MKPKLLVKLHPFPLRIFAYLSTVHITKEDGKLLDEADSDTPQTCGTDEYGTWLWLPTPVDWRKNNTRGKLEKAGFSKPFCNLMERICRARISYVRFDRDGEVVEELPKFEW